MIILLERVNMAYQRMLGERMEEKEYNFIYGTNAFQELSIGVYICSKISKKVFLQ
ncbi:hypothetical protein [Orientia tsutsugamushi]|uniref:Uncharacterized protein n=1 Tax=Orientia tsutsugamushi str. TA716 TaxID=1359175 RepID=A0A0F3P1A6_ORITS|nr:hypothetical protein [Orientia tsutsugamushi]KJV73736.1 hypothetical protein OTSTA716_1499 [Orientia tsutsugamushi str. TA716]